MTTTFITRKQTDTAVRKARTHVARYVAQLSAISKNPTEDRVAEITAMTLTEVLFAALQHAPVKPAGHTNADITLQTAAATAARLARESISPVVSCNLNAARLHRQMTESTEEWLHRNAPVLQAGGQAVRDVYRAFMLACTDALQHHQDTQPARQQAINLAGHVTTVFDTVTNTEAIRKRMPTPAVDHSPFLLKRKAENK